MNHRISLSGLKKITVVGTINPACRQAGIARTDKMTIQEVKTAIEKSIPGSTAYVLDPMNDGQHLQAFVISPAFEKKMLVQQHQMVMAPLKGALAGAVHALALKTFTPAKWQEVKSQYGYG